MSAVMQIEGHAERLPAAHPSLGAVTPLAMLNRAVADGASVEVMSKLMDLHERWEAGQARKAFDAAIADAKSEIGPIVRNKAGHNNKRYADFAAIASAVDPVLGKHGLSYRFRTRQEERIFVTCILSHKAGHSEETTLSGPADASGSKNAIQAIGSTLTYLQRYSLVQMLGLAATDDDDGRAAAQGLTDEQVEDLRQRIISTDASLPDFLKWAGVERIEQMRPDQYRPAVSMLDQKASRAREAKR